MAGSRPRRCFGDPSWSRRCVEMDLLDRRGVGGILVELVRARSAGRRCVHAPSALHPAPHAIAPFSQALFDRRRSYRSVLLDSADVVRSIGIELVARSAMARTSRSDVGLVTAVCQTGAAKRAWQGCLQAMCDSGGPCPRSHGLVHVPCQCARSPSRQLERRTAELIFVQIISRAGC